jgi:hypothetical protein
MALVCAAGLGGPAWAQNIPDLPNNFPNAANKGVWVDQAGAPHPWKVGLATNAGAPVWDTDLAAMSAPLARKGVLMHFSMAQCFGGGMLQDLAAINNPNPGRQIRVSGGAAARWNQAAWYRESPYAVMLGGMLPNPNNHNKDWADQYIAVSGGATAADTATGRAWQRDHFALGGAARGPDEAGRFIGGAVQAKLETGQYRESAAGAGNAFKHNTNAVKTAILYSGQPGGHTTPAGQNAWTPLGGQSPEQRPGNANIDAGQIVDMWNVLIANGYAAGDIQVVFGNGALPAGAPAAMMGRVVAATLPNLRTAFMNIGNLDQGDQFFFFANDHGTARNAAMPADRWLNVPKSPWGLPWHPQSPSPGSPSGLERYLPDANDPFLGWAADPYYVPTPGTLVLAALGGLVAARRRRSS